MGYTDVDTLAINTIRVLAVGSLLLTAPPNKKNPAPANGRVSAPP